MGQRNESARAYWWNAEVYRLEGNWQTACEHSDRGLEVAPRYSRLLGTRSVLDSEMGEIAQSEAHLEQLLEAWRHAGERTSSYEASFLAVVIPVVACITGVANRLDAAQQAAEAVLSSASLLPLQALTANTGLALVAVQLGDIAAAEEHYAALEPQGGTMLPGWIANVDRLLGLLAQTTGKLDLAIAHFEDALVFCRHREHQGRISPGNGHLGATASFRCPTASRPQHH